MLFMGSISYNIEKFYLLPFFNFFINNKEGLDHFKNQKVSQKEEIHQLKEERVKKKMQVHKENIKKLIWEKISKNN